MRKPKSYELQKNTNVSNRFYINTKDLMIDKANSQKI